MNARITLSTTTLVETLSRGETQARLASLTGIFPGVCLFMDQELTSVEYLTGISTYVRLRRGQAGTETRAHAGGTTVTIGTGDQFYSSDPTGMPANPPNVLPHINVVNGSVWTVSGDEAGPSADGRIWQKLTTVTGTGPLGVSTAVQQADQ